MVLVLRKAVKVAPWLKKLNTPKASAPQPQIAPALAPPPKAPAMPALHTFPGHETPPAAAAPPQTVHPLLAGLKNYNKHDHIAPLHADSALGPNNKYRKGAQVRAPGGRVGLVSHTLGDGHYGVVMAHGPMVNFHHDELHALTSAEIAQAPPKPTTAPAGYHPDLQHGVAHYGKPIMPLPAGQGQSKAGNWKVGAQVLGSGKPGIVTQNHGGGLYHITHPDHSHDIYEKDRIAALDPDHPVTPPKQVQAKVFKAKAVPPPPPPPQEYDPTVTPTADHKAAYKNWDIHQIPQDEYVKLAHESGKKAPTAKSVAAAQKYHFAQVKEALTYGKDVPEAVYASSPASQIPAYQQKMEAVRERAARVEAVKGASDKWRFAPPPGTLPQGVPGATGEVQARTAHHVARQLASHAEHSGKSHQQVIDDLHDTLRDGTDPQHTHLAFRLPHRDLHHILDDRLRSQVELPFDPARGQEDHWKQANDKRKQAERHMYGHPEDLPHHQYPTYGYIDHNDERKRNKGVAMFGNAKVHLKDTMRPHTTFTVGDSLGPGLDAKLIGAPLDHPHLGAADGHAGALARAAGATRLPSERTPAGRAAYALDENHAEFWEAHFHKPVTHQDIRHVTFYHDGRAASQPDAKLLAKLKQHGITHSLKKRSRDEEDTLGGWH